MMKTTIEKETLKHINIDDSFEKIRNMPTGTFGDTFSRKIDKIGSYLDTIVFPKISCFSKNVFRTIISWAILGILVSFLVQADPTFSTEYPLIYEFSQFGLKVFETTLAFGKECCMDFFRFIQNFTFWDLFLFPYKFIVEVFRNLSVFATLL